MIWFPTRAAFVKIFLPIRIWSVPRFTDKITFRANEDKTSINYSQVNQTSEKKNYKITYPSTQRLLSVIDWRGYRQSHSFQCSGFVRSFVLQPTGPGPVYMVSGGIVEAMLMPTLLKTVTNWKLIFIFLQNLLIKLNWSSPGNSRFTCWGHQFWTFFMLIEAVNILY